ncbi:MAG: membrane protein [Candidatus Acidiferrum sp.]
MSTPLLFLLAFAIGIVAGLRTFTAPAALAWAAHLHWINLVGTPLAFLHSPVALVIFTLLAVVEFVGDQLPSTPSRTKPGPLGARIVSGAFCGTAVALLGGQAMVVGAFLGAIGAVAGAFGGYQVRTRSVEALGVPDFVIAIPEDLLAIAAGFFIFSRF